MQLAEHIVQMVCHGFDSDPFSGQKRPRRSASLSASRIESLGFEELLSNPEQIQSLIEGNPLLKQRSAHAKWPGFQEDFLNYMMDRFGVEPADEAPKVAGPQPVA